MLQNLKKEIHKLTRILHLFNWFWSNIGEHVRVESGLKGGPKMEPKLDPEKSGSQRPPSPGNRSWECTFAPGAGSGAAAGVGAVYK